MGTNWKQLDMNLCSKDSSVVLIALEELKETKKEFGQEATEAIIPKCMDKLLHHDIKTRASAMAVLANQIQIGNTSMVPHLDVLCKKLQNPNMLDLSAGKDDQQQFISLHTNMCFTFGTLQNNFPRKLMTSFKPICHYLIDCTEHEYKEVASAGVQFWAKMNVPPVPPNLMEVWIPAVLIKLNKLIPAILGDMMYQEDHVNYLERQGNNRSSMGADIEKLADLRNYAALAFENLCRMFQTEAKAIFKPLLERRVMSDNWVEMEASLLALSAFTAALGTPQEMKDLYPVLIPRLLELYSHPKALVRAITCFTMQHFIGVKMKQVKDPFPKVIKSTTALLGDSSPEVSVMALRSMAAILAYSDQDCSPYSEKITDALANFTPSDKETKSTYFETIGHYFGRMGTLVEQDETRRLIAPLMDQWRSLNPDSSEKDETAILCTSLCTIAAFTKSNFAPYTEPLFEKSANYLEKVAHGSKNSRSENSSNNLVAYMDLLSAVIEGQGTSIQSLAEKYDVVPKLLELLKEKKTQPQVVQSAFALLGNLSNYCYESVEPHVDHFLQIIQAKLASKLSSLEIKNNAVWCLSYFSEKGEEPSDNLLMMTDMLIQILKDTQSDQGIIINAALTLTNLGMIWPKQMNNAVTNDEVFMNICMLLQMSFPRDLERDRLFKNLVCISQENLKKIKVASWAQYCRAAAVVTSQDASLNSMLKTNLKDVRSSLGQNGWKKLSLQIGPQLAYALRKKYKLY